MAGKMTYAPLKDCPQAVDLTLRVVEASSGFKQGR